VSLHCAGASELKLSPGAVKEIIMIKFLMAPSNAVCDRLGLTDEHERGMLRMLVNMLNFTAIVVAVFYVAWRAFE
jgi:hypothetical protein